MATCLDFKKLLSTLCFLPLVLIFSGMLDSIILNVFLNKRTVPVDSLH